MADVPEIADGKSAAHSSSDDIISLGGLHEESKSGHDGFSTSKLRLCPFRKAPLLAYGDGDNGGLIIAGSRFCLASDEPRLVPNDDFLSGGKISPSTGVLGGESWKVKRPYRLLLDGNINNTGLSREDDRAGIDMASPDDGLRSTTLALLGAMTVAQAKLSP